MSVLLETIENVPKADGLALKRQQFIHCSKHYTRQSATSRGAISAFEDLFVKSVNIQYGYTYCKWN
mgnify:CR=1 FL=1